VKKYIFPSSEASILMEHTLAQVFLTFLTNTILRRSFCHLKFFITSQRSSDLMSKEREDQKPLSQQRAPLSTLRIHWRVLRRKDFLVMLKRWINRMVTTKRSNRSSKFPLRSTTKRRNQRKVINKAKQSSQRPKIVYPLQLMKLRAECKH
jgi:hypothetical protein